MDGVSRASDLTGGPRVTARRDVSLLASMAFLSLVIGGTYFGGSSVLAIYALSFWHYYLYWLAYRFGRVSPGVFKRDAIAMKAVSLAALASVYLSAPPDLLSLATVASGFLLNVVAAWALGSDRTYYGQEIEDLPRRQVTTFPYSWMSHPMLVGNIAAFGGTMINAEFRRQWWPLACAHVALNLGLLFMELALAARARAGDRGSIQTGCLVGATGALTGGAVSHWGGWSAHAPFAAGLGACVGAYAYVLHCGYALRDAGWRTDPA